MIISQYIPSKLSWQKNGSNIFIQQTIASKNGDIIPVNDLNRTQQYRQSNISVITTVKCDQVVEFNLRYRVPWWVGGKVRVLINDKEGVMSLTCLG